MKFKKIFGRELSKMEEAFLYSVALTCAFIMMGFLAAIVYNNMNFLYNFLFISVFVFILPIFFVKYMELRDIRDCEKYFPTFLDDLRESKGSGVSFPQAIKNCQGEYGALNKHVKKIQNDLSWEVTIDNSLKYFRKQMSGSKLLSRSLSILLETYRSGGNVEGILQTLRGSLLKIMESEDYRKSMMRQHVMMMYGIFIMYIVLVVMLGHFLIPMLTEMSNAGAEGDFGGIQMMQVASPCIACEDSLCFFLCSSFTLISGMFGFGSEPLEVYYKSLFFSMVLVQGLFTGIIAGQIANKSWVDGMKHGLIMMLIGFVAIMLANAGGLF
jgi:flagellar protein FlaJ